MTYEIKDLYIGRIGVVQNKEYHYHMKDISFAIVTKCAHSDLFKNVITEETYIDFFMGKPKNKDIAIGSGDKYKRVLSLFEYIQENYKKFKNSNEIILSIITKIINQEPINKDEIAKLNCYLNDKKLFKKLYLSKKDNTTNNTNKKNYNQTLTNNVEDPIVIREELSDIILNLAEELKNPILVGHIGVGKNTLVKGLNYKIQKNDVPNFIKGKKIINITDTLKHNGTIDVGKLIKNRNIILIEDIYSIFNTDNHCDIKAAIKNGQLKVIGTTNIKNDTNSFSDDSLNNSFNRITINEPNDEILFEIIEKVFNYYSKKNNISLLDNVDDIINTLIELTNIENRTYYNTENNDYENSIYNPELVIEIIDKIFAHAKVNNSKKLDTNDIVYGIKSCYKIYDKIKNNFITKIKELQNKNKTKSKIKYDYWIDYA